MRSNGIVNAKLDIDQFNEGLTTSGVFSSDAVDAERILCGRILLSLRDRLVTLR